MTPRLVTAMFVIVNVVPHIGAVGAQNAGLARSDLLGAWRLTRVETVRPNGEVYLPFGEHVIGTLAYLASGDVVVAWGRADRPEFAKPNSPSSGELVAAVEDYFNAYIGTFEFDAAAQQVRHHMRGGLRPGGAGRTLVRDVQLRGATLMLTQPAEPCPAREAGKCNEGRAGQNAPLLGPIRVTHFAT